MPPQLRPKKVTAAPPVETSAAGERLDAALAADQSQRNQLQRKWEGRLQRHTKSWAAFDMIMGKLTLGFGAAFVASIPISLVLWVIAPFAILAFLAFMAVLFTNGLGSALFELRQRGMARAALREGIDLPAVRVKGF